MAQAGLHETPFQIPIKNNKIFDLKMKRNPVQKHNTDDSRGHYAKLDKPDTKEQVCYASASTSIWKGKFIKTGSRIDVFRC